MKQTLINLFSNTGSPSIKRVSGFLGWLVCLGLVIYATITGITVIAAIDSLFLFSTTLLGLDTITNIWKKDNELKINKEN